MGHPVDLIGFAAVGKMKWSGGLQPRHPPDTHLSRAFYFADNRRLNNGRINYVGKIKDGEERDVKGSAHGCQMAIAKFLDCMCLALRA